MNTTDTEHRTEARNLVLSIVAIAVTATGLAWALWEVLSHV